MLPFILHPSFDNDAGVNSFELSGIPSGGISGGGISGGGIYLRCPYLSYLTCVRRCCCCRVEWGLDRGARDRGAR